MLVITCLRDRVADRFLNVNLEPNVKAACRSFSNALAAVRDDLNHPIVANPEDFDLMYIGDFDEETGLIKKNDVRVLMTGLEVFSALDSQEKDYENISYPIPYEEV